MIFVTNYIEKINKLKKQKTRVKLRNSIIFSLPFIAFSFHCLNKHWLTDAIQSGHCRICTTPRGKCVDNRCLGWIKRSISNEWTFKPTFSVPSNKKISFTSSYKQHTSSMSGTLNRVLKLISHCDRFCLNCVGSDQIIIRRLLLPCCRACRSTPGCAVRLIVYKMYNCWCDFFDWWLYFRCHCRLLLIVLFSLVCQLSSEQMFRMSSCQSEMGFCLLVREFSISPIHRWIVT